MLPEVHVNLDRPTIHHIYELFLPLFPGGALVVGLVVAHPQFSIRAAAAGIGYYSRVTAVVFVAYAAGLILYALSTLFGALLSFSLTNLYFGNPKLRPVRNNRTISQNHVWRTVAATFLGQPLVPPPPATGLFTTVPPPPQLATQHVLQYDLDWNDWYDVLQDYVLRKAPLLPPEAHFFWTIIQATGWAFAVLSLQPGLGRHWSILIVVVPVVVLSALIQFGSTYSYFKYDRLTPADFTARLLAEIRQREDASRGVAPASPTAGSPQV
jgi:hypothetical protein